MKTATREKQMGRFSVDVELANYRDIVESESGHLEKAKVRSLTIQGVVDSGAARLVGVLCAVLVGVVRLRACASQDATAPSAAV